MVKLVASDLDGTIIDKQNNICYKNFEAINYLNQNNINFVVCTGKTYSLSKELCSKLNASYGIFGNGNEIVNLKTGEEIYKNLLKQSEVIKCIEIAKNSNLHVHLYSNCEVITENLSFMDLRNYTIYEKDSSLKFSIVKNILDYVKNNKLEIYKVIISSTGSLSELKEEITNSLDVSVTKIAKRNEYKDYIINKEYEYLDIYPKNIDKDIALNILSKYLRVNKNEILSIGDNLNDFSMVKNAGIGIAVANAYAELKQVAKYTTKSNVENGGFAEAVYKFIEI